MSNPVDVRIKAMDIATGFSSGLSYSDYTNVFRMLTHAGIDHYLYKEDLLLLHELAINPKYNIVSKKEKLSVYDQILNPRGFYRSHSGTNRVVYSHYTDDTFIIKIALDHIGKDDNAKEFYNQKVLQPFIPKIFDISDNEAVILMEKVKPILNREEFSMYANSIFNLITYLVGCGYVLEDIGTDFFMNWGIRKDFGPVLLDFPYMYRVNKSRLNCIQRNIDGSQCKGHIIYDDGYNYLVCDTCNKRYAAKDIGSSFKYLSEIKSKMKRRGSMNFTFKVSRGNEHYEIKSGASVVEEDASRNIIPKIENGTSRFITSRNSKPTSNDGENALTKFINKHNSEAKPQRPVQNVPTTERQKYTNNNNLIISTILKEFGYGTEDISDNLITAITEAMEENVHKYITVANKIELTSTLKEMSDKQREEYEEKVKRILHANRIRIEENDIFTHYFSTNAYYDREKMRDVIRDALAKYRADVHVDETPIKQEEQEVAKEEPKKEETVKVEEKKTVVTPNDIKMKFENANALGDPVMTTMSAVEDVGVQKKVKIDNKTFSTKPKVTAEDEF